MDKDMFIIDEIKVQLYSLYVHDVISSVEHSKLIDRLYDFYSTNENFSYVDVIKYVFGGYEDEANASDTEKG